MISRRSLGLALLAAVILPGGATAQTIRLGAEFGVGRSTFRGTSEPGLQNYRTGVVGGVLVGISLTPVLMIESGAEWIEKGAEGNAQGIEGPFSAAMRLNYVQVPLVLRITPFPGRRLRPSLLLGPTVAHEVACKFDFDPLETAAILPCSDSERRHVDIGFRTGAGISWAAGRVTLNTEGRYDAGLRDLDPSTEAVTRNRGFALITGIAIPLRR